MKMVADLSEFESELKSAGSKLVIVDFYADWCGPCRMIAPKLEEFSNTYTDCVFLKVNVDEADDISSKYGISAMPTFKFFKNGEVVTEVVGASEAKVKEAIEQNK